MAALPLSLLRRALGGLIVFIAAMAAIFVVSAQSFSYWEGWAYLANFAVCSAALTLWLAYRDPALLERRLSAGPAAEREPAQKAIQAVNVLGFLGLFIVAGLDYRFGWSTVPLVVVVIGQLMVALCFLLWAVVFRENSFAASTVEIAADQRVIDTGLYGLVRHPMYAAGLLLFIGTPLALGSYWALLATLVVIPGLIGRLLHEEHYLDANLPGYRAYRHQVPWRLVPRVW